MDSESEDDSVQQSLIHEMDLAAMEQRRRVVRNVDGQIMTSYRDLFNPHPATDTSNTEFDSH